MALGDAFLNLVIFKPQGLDQIDAGLNRTKATQDRLTIATERYNQAFASTARVANAYERNLRSGVLATRVRETEALVRSHERLNRLMERQSVLSRIGGIAAGVGGAIGGVGGALGAAAFGTGISGLSGTVPMARLQNQFNRLAWELGNTLTPQIEAVTKRIAGAANWLNRRSETEQDLIGYGLTGAGVLGGARLLGLPVGAAIGATGRAAFSGARGLAGMAGIGRAAPAVTEAQALYASLYGSQGLPAAATGAGIGLSRIAGSVGLGATVAGSQIALKYNTASMLRASEGSDTTGLGAIGKEYEDRFRGLSGADRNRAINAERAVQLKKEKEGIGRYYGEGGNVITQMGERLLSAFGLTTMGDTAQAQQASERLKVLNAMYAGKNVGGHRANAFVGGEFREVGAGYYEAASAFAKAGFDKAGGGVQPQADVLTVLEQIRDKLPNADHPPAPGNGNNAAFVGGNFRAG